MEATTQASLGGFLQAHASQMDGTAETLRAFAAAIADYVVDVNIFSDRILVKGEPELIDSLIKDGILAECPSPDDEDDCDDRVDADADELLEAAAR